MLLNVLMFVMQELCGAGSNRPDFLTCMIKTRQWQDAQVVSKGDHRPWKAYYRVLGHLDSQRAAANEDRGFQQKFTEWLHDCLQHQDLGLYSFDVWRMFDGIRNHGFHGPDFESDLQEWQDSFRNEPLHIQWAQDSATVAAANVLPVLPLPGSYNQGPSANMQPLHVTEAAAALPAAQNNLQLATGCSLPDDHLDEMGPEDFEGLSDALIAGAAAAEEMQLHVEQMQAAMTANNQPNVALAATLPGPVQKQLEVSCCCRASR